MSLLIFKDCNLSNLPNFMLRDHLVCELCDEQIHKLLADSKLTAAFNIALMGEATVHQSIQIHGNALNSINMEK